MKEGRQGGDGLVCEECLVTRYGGWRASVMVWSMVSHRHSAAAAAARRPPAAAAGSAWQPVAAQSTCRRIQNYSEDSSGERKENDSNSFPFKFYKILCRLYRYPILT